MKSKLYILPAALLSVTCGKTSFQKAASDNTSSVQQGGKNGEAKAELPGGDIASSPSSAIDPQSPSVSQTNDSLINPSNSANPSSANNSVSGSSTNANNSQQSNSNSSQQNTQQAVAAAAAAPAPSSAPAPVYHDCVVSTAMTIGWHENYSAEDFAYFTLPADAKNAYFRVDRSVMLTNDSLRNAMSGTTYAGELMLDRVSTGVQHIQTQEVQLNKGDVTIASVGYHEFSIPSTGACPLGAGYDCVRFSMYGRLVYSTATSGCTSALLQKQR